LLAHDRLRRGQVRAFSRDLSQAAAIEKISLESYDNGIAPVFVAITAETGDLKATGNWVSTRIGG